MRKPVSSSVLGGLLSGVNVLLGRLAFGKNRKRKRQRLEAPGACAHHSECGARLRWRGNRRLHLLPPPPPIRLTYEKCSESGARAIYAAMYLPRAGGSKVRRLRQPAAAPRAKVTSLQLRQVGVRPDTCYEAPYALSLSLHKQLARSPYTPLCAEWPGTKTGGGCAAAKKILRFYIIPERMYRPASRTRL